MAYDEALAQRIRTVIGERPDITEKKMFGGVAFLLEGKMFVGIVRDDLMVRVGPDAHEGALAEPHVRPMDFSGRPMQGYVYVAPDGLRSDAALASWVERALSHAATLPAKSKPRTSTRKKAAKRRG